MNKKQIEKLLLLFTEQQKLNKEVLQKEIVVLGKQIDYKEERMQLELSIYKSMKTLKDLKEYEKELTHLKNNNFEVFEINETKYSYELFKEAKEHLKYVGYEFNNNYFIGKKGLPLGLLFERFENSCENSYILVIIAPRIELDDDAEAKGDVQNG